VKELQWVLGHWCGRDQTPESREGDGMSGIVTLEGTLKSDGTLELDKKPDLAPGRVRVTVEPVSEPART